MDKNFKKEGKKGFLIFLLVFISLFSVFSCAEEIIISNIRFENTETETTASWNTNLITKGTFTYYLEQEKKSIDDFKIAAYHEVKFPTELEKEYVYSIKSCEPETQNCAVQNGSFKTKKFFFDVEVPEVTRLRTLSLSGNTFPKTNVRVFVDGMEKKRIITTEEKFFIYGIDLNPENNEVKIIAEHDLGRIEKVFNVFVDLHPPVISVDLAKISTQKTIDLKGHVNEKVNIFIKVNEKKGNNSFQKNQTVINDFSIPVELFEGENEIILIAEDLAGHRVTIKKEVIYDLGPPQFIETNLEKLSPSYNRVITIRGQVNEKASITVFLNKKAEKTVLTDDDGKFSVQVSLKTTGLEVSSEEMRLMLQVGGGYENKIKLHATDVAGLTSETPEYTVVYAICGQGSWFQSKISEPIPEILTPRLLLEGIQQMGLAFELEKKTSKDVIIRHNGIKAKVMLLNPSVEKEYDNKLININTIALPVKGYENEKVKGYIQFNFNAFDPLFDDPDATTIERLKALSDYRRGDCLVPGLGCMRFMLELEIPFQEKTIKRSVNPYTNEAYEEEVYVDQVQKICIQQEILIDQIIPPDIIPSGFLKLSSDILGVAIDGIDLVLKPLEFVGKATTIGCLGGNVLLYALKVKENFACEFSAGANLLTGDVFSPDVARAGLCEAYKSENAKNNCLICAKASQSYLSAKRIIQEICDRVACPDAPTLQNYIKRQKGNLRRINVPESAVAEKFSIGGKVYSGSDCAAWLEKNEKVDKTLIISDNDVKGIYRDYLDHKGDSDKTDSGGINCAGAHPASAECCGYEYMQTWGSACGISQIEFLDSFDEIKESACLSAERVGLNKINIDGTTIECNKLWNSVAGFCEKEGGPATESRQVIKFSDDKIEELGLSEFSPEQMLYIFAIPLTEEEKLRVGSALRDSMNRHIIKLGYIVQSIEFTKSDKSNVIAKADRHYLTARLEAVELDIKENLNADFFNSDIIEDYYKTGKISDDKAGEFRKVLCSAAGKGEMCLHTNEARDIYEDIINIIGTDEKEYIVRPSSSLLRSGQCICLPGLVGNLKLWRNIASAVKNCFDLVRISGEGSEGVCQAVLETYVCELIYEGIKCFTDSYSPRSSAKRFDTGGIGDFFSAISDAGSKISFDVEERYGSTGMFKAMFVDKKLLHSVCAFAFTGSWSLDLDSLFDMSVAEVPLESSAVIYPCERRFVGYNPASYPVKGLSTWTYRFGIMAAAGSDLNLRLKLKCSQGFKCRESDGFINGACDCKNMEKVIELTPAELSQQVKKYEIFNKEIFATIQDDDSSIRYDTAELSWSWTDPAGTLREDSTTCRIKQVGTPPPSFCSFDIFTLSFRCVFGEQEGGILFRDLTIDSNKKMLLNNKNITVFEKGDALNATLLIKQDYPIPPKPIYTKYLAWHVADASGKIILLKDPAESEFFGKSILQTNGDYSVTTNDLGIGPIDINDIFFSKETVLKVERFYSDDGRYELYDSIVASNIKRTLYGQNYDSIAKYLFEIDNGEFKLTISDDRLNYVEKKFEGSISDNKVIFSDDGGFRIEIDVSKINTELSTTLRLTFSKENIFERTPNEPKLYKLTFTAYDSDRYGAPTSVKSTDPTTGKTASIAKEFYVVCGITEEAEEKELNLRQIKSVVEDYIKIENNFLKTINSWLNLNVEAISKDLSEIKNKLTEIVNKEKEIKQKLTPIIEKNEFLKSLIFINQLSECTEKLININFEGIEDYKVDKIRFTLENFIERINDVIVEKEYIITHINSELGIKENCPTETYECKDFCISDKDFSDSYSCPDNKKCCSTELKEGQIISEINKNLRNIVERCQNFADKINAEIIGPGIDDKNYGDRADTVYSWWEEYIKKEGHAQTSFENIKKLNKNNYNQTKKNLINTFITQGEDFFKEITELSNKINEKEGNLPGVQKNITFLSKELKEFSNSVETTRKTFIN
jgi:hypothetical protein